MQKKKNEQLARVQFGKIEYDVVTCSAIPLEAKMVYCYLCVRSDNFGTSCASVETMVKELNISRARFYRALNVLKEIGLVEVKKGKWLHEKNHFDSNEYQLCDKLHARYHKKYGIKVNVFNPKEFTKNPAKP